MEPVAEALPPYHGIARADVRLVRTDEEAQAARAALLAADVIGFDTESKPTFVKGEASTGPHLVQLATDSHVYLFQIGPHTAVDVIKDVLEAPGIVKAGFGLDDDIKRLRAKLGINTVNVIDLANLLRNGQRNPVGAKTAVARYFGKALQKSKKITTTNWSLPRLSEQQILYAADDAHVALRVYRLWRENPVPPFSA